MDQFRAILVTLAALPCAAVGTVAQTPGTPAQCATEQYRQFDFWVGEWEVHNPQGQYQGANRIEKIQGGCVLQEHWTGAGGSTGTSFSMYDFTRDVWHQTWVSGTQLLVIEGAVRDGRMVLEGETVGRGGAVTHNRITWTPVARDTVTQVWDTSPDRRTWQTVFHGVYTRK